MADWQVGDHGICVIDGPIFCACGHRHGNWFAPVKRGQGGEVSAISIAQTVAPHSPGECCGCAVLRIGGSWGLAQRFVKITPGAKIEGVEVEREVPKRVKQDA